MNVMRALVGVLISLSSMFALASPVQAQLRSEASSREVMVIPDAKMAIRYSARSRSGNVRALIRKVPKSQVFECGSQRLVGLYEDFSGLGISATPEKISIECIPVGQIEALKKEHFTHAFLENKEVNRVTSQWNLSQFCDWARIKPSSAKEIVSFEVFDIMNKGKTDEMKLPDGKVAGRVSEPACSYFLGLIYCKDRAFVIAQKPHIAVVESFSISFEIDLDPGSERGTIDISDPKHGIFHR